MLLLPTLPPLPSDFGDGDACTGLSTPVGAWDDDEVLVLTTTFAAAAADDDEGESADFAHARRGPKSKAEIQATLADRDPYRLLGLDELRWRASTDDIKKAYRKMVLLHHPDKQMGAEAAEQRVAQKQQADEEGGEDEEAKPADEEVDEMFKAITEAFELLSDAKRRRDFDSLDDFDDSLPPKDYSAATHGDFFATFGPVFERNSRWSELPNAPLLGAADGAFDDVAAFYNFWFAFKSWRDFADADEYDLEEAHFREEKRWMERQNEKLRVKKRRAEASRIQRLVELAYAHDPRVLAEKARAKESKAAAKAERAAALQRDKDAAAAAAAAKEAAKAEVERLAAEKEKAEAAERKRQKEKAAKAVRKGRARLRALISGEAADAPAGGGGGGGGDPLCDGVGLELLCARLDAEKLDALCASIEAASARADKAALVQAAIDAEQTAAERAEAEKREADKAAAAAAAEAAGGGNKAAWTEDELSLLVKAANKFPGGVPDRWERMAEFINHFASPSHGRTADDVTAKVKERRRELEVKKAVAAAERNRQDGRTLAAATQPAPPPKAAQPATAKAAQPARMTTKHLTAMLPER